MTAKTHNNTTVWHQTTTSQVARKMMIITNSSGAWKLDSRVEENEEKREGFLWQSKFAFYNLLLFVSPMISKIIEHFIISSSPSRVEFYDDLVSLFLPFTHLHCVVRLAGTRGRRQRRWKLEDSTETAECCCAILRNKLWDGVESLDLTWMLNSFLRKTWEKWRTWGIMKNNIFTIISIFSTLAVRWRMN